MEPVKRASKRAGDPAAIERLIALRPYIEKQCVIRKRLAGQCIEYAWAADDRAEFERLESLAQEMTTIVSRLDFPQPFAGHVTLIGNRAKLLRGRKHQDLVRDANIVWLATVWHSEIRLCLGTNIVH
jgi:hypothetical protein